MKGSLDFSLERRDLNLETWIKVFGSRNPKRMKFWNLIYDYYWIVFFRSTIGDETVDLFQIVHTMIGFVKASILITSLQILFRIFNTFGVFNLIPTNLDTIGVPMTLFAWCGAEITRYSFHIFKEINFVPYFVTWIR